MDIDHTEHLLLAQFLKEVHGNLRKSSAEIGAEKAWIEHCENKHVLATYAQCMEKLATTHWESNSVKETSAAISRIKWTTDFCCDYFKNELYLVFNQKEKNIADKIGLDLEREDAFHLPLELIDVGSCYNPFKNFQYFKVFAIDLYPVNKTVYQCDFLEVPVGLETIVKDNRVKLLKEHYYDIVTFCFLLEYLPNPKLRINACEKAYQILRPGGLLIINTPDSKHVGANSKIMKCWRYSLACMGFMRIKYEKFKHMHCMAFRKALLKNVAVRWAELHKEPYMEYTINIPQDLCKESKENLSIVKVVTSNEDFKELPFYDT